jgi:hypothetical protein
LQEHLEATKIENTFLRQRLVLAESRRRTAEAMIEAGEAREKKLEDTVKAAIESIKQL